MLTNLENKSKLFIAIPSANAEKLDSKAGMSMTLFWLRPQDLLLIRSIARSMESGKTCFERAANLGPYLVQSVQIRGVVAARVFHGVGVFYDGRRN